MSDDDDWEFTALEKDKRTLPELVIEVGGSGKSYADAVLQQCSKVEILEIDDMPHEIVGTEKSTFMKVKPGRKQELKRQLKAKNKDDKFVARILKRENPINVELNVNHKTLVSLAEDFALSEACSAMIIDVACRQSNRMAYTKLLEVRS